MQRKTQKRQKALGWFLAALILALYFSPPMNRLRALPEDILLLEGQEQVLNFGLPLSTRLTQAGAAVSASGDERLSDVVSEVELTAQKEGNAQLKLRLWGVIPVKTVSLVVKSGRNLIPGGHSIGVALKTQGVLVVGMSDLAGQITSPARIAGLKSGDRIEKVGQTPVTGAAHLSQLVDEQKGDAVTLSVVRGGKQMKMEVQPQLDGHDGVYRLGVWVRDSTAGVGTLSFYDPVSGAFGALGHPVTDADTGALLSVEEGEIYHSKVVQVRQGQRGNPGELMGDFLGDGLTWGQIHENTEFGLYGKSSARIENPLYPDGLPIATRDKVKTGPATLLTTLNGDEIREYSCEITRIYRQDTPAQRSMIVRITDPRLLSATGGIVQGMSGSPLIQDGHLIGAITHVYVNDPTQGYGLYMDWMLYSADMPS